VNELISNEKNLQDYIFTIRGKQVMIDRDLALLYQVETRALKQAVKRNIDRFPQDFIFELTNDEIEYMVSQNVIPSKKHLGGAKPLAFTEQGISMLSAVLKSKVAIEVSIKIIRAFVQMRKVLLSNASIFQRLENVEQKLLTHDKNFEKIFKALENQNEIPTQGIFYNGQIWDAYELINSLLKSAKKEVVLIDNYIDDTVLTLFSKYPKLNYTIITKTISKQLKLDIQKYNSQYNNLTIKTSNKYHDRFLLIDSESYHLGASLKDLGKKVFAFSKIDRGLLKV